MGSIRLQVHGVGVDTRQRPLVALVTVDDPAVLIPIWIGFAEVAAIQVALEGRQPLRPMTHDLLAKILNVCDTQVVNVEITDCCDRVYYAVIRCRYLGEKKEIDARPSDAIVLALKANAPIFIKEELLVEHGYPVEQPDDQLTDDTARLKTLLDGVDLDRRDEE